MRKNLLVPIILFVFLNSAHSQEKVLSKGMTISRSLKIKRAFYKIDAVVSLDQSVIVIEGDNITIDFNNSTLTGSNSKSKPDEFFGVAIMIRNSKNVTIRNLKAKGYKVALMARNVEHLTLDNCDFSYNYRQHLNSTQQKEDISDWMSYHHNEKDEWLRYGAAMYLRNCDYATIKDCAVTDGQNALMMMECNDAVIYHNDFSFNSGIGIGLYKSNRNKIFYNQIIFNVRGYSHGVYNRGQDSAGILVYEQSNNNLFYKNDVTHSGDGFFLWAGQTTMDNGQGGCNDNIIMGNDFSYAPTNGVEVTFSRNKIIDNRIYECDHGIWGGYSFDTDISSNKFRNNRIGIAIEHGQQNKITYNVFLQDKEAIRLWANKEQPSDWGYPKFRDTRSRDYIIAFNSINKIPLAFDLRQTDSLNIFNNSFVNCDLIYKTDSTLTNLDTTVDEKLATQLSSDTTTSVPDIDRSIMPIKFSNELAGRKNILMTEWGPYDFRSPIIWNTNPADTSDEMKFDLLGPKGKWKIVSSRGVENISATSGIFPASIIAHKIKADKTDIMIELEYSGSGITSLFGKKNNAGKPYKFYFTKFFQPIDWIVNWYAADTSMNDLMKANDLFEKCKKLNSLQTEKTTKLNYAWWDGIKGKDDKQYIRFITIAEGNADFVKGDYELEVTWDDAVRVYVDDKLTIDEWNPSLYNFDEAPHKIIRLHLAGNHRFRVEHANVDGFATLSLDFKRIQ